VSRWVLILVLVLAVVAVGLGVFVWWGGDRLWSSQPPIPGKESGPQPAPRAERAAYTEEEVLAHPFWKQRPTKAELDGLLDRLLAEAGPKELAVGDNGKAWERKDDEEKGGGSDRYVVLRRPAGGGRPAALNELFERMTQVTDREKYKARYDAFNKKKQ
jgi:hypothetical protein